MARPRTKTLTEGELRIMDVVWRLQRASVREVADALRPRSDLAYNTVQTMLGILTEKGYLARVKEGRAYVYEATVTRGAARRQALAHLLDRFFGGSKRELVLDLVEDENVDAAELDELRALLSGHGGGDASQEGEDR